MTTNDLPSKPAKVHPTGFFDVWCTKYALTKGVFKVRGKVWDGDRDMAKPALSVADADRKARGLDSLLFHGHWHHTEAEASARVKVMLVNERKSIAKKVTALDVVAHDLNNGILPMAK